MGKASMMAITAFLVVGLTRQQQVQNTQVATEHRDAQTRYEVLARNAASYGFERAKQYIAGAASLQGGSKAGSYQSAAYSATIGFTGNVATVRTSGTTVDGSGLSSSYRIVSQIERQTVLPSSAPLFMQFALLAHDDLTLSGSILVDTFRVEGDTRAPANANIHTNGTLKVNGGAALVRGFGTYAVSEQVGHENRVFNPYSNPTGAAVLSRTSAVKLPGFSPGGTADSLGRDRSTGSTSLSGTMDFTALGATRDNPYVWHVAGDLTVSSTTRLKGYVVFLVNGSITLDGNETISLDDGLAESNVAWYAGGNITLRGNTEIWGQFYTKNDVIFTGTPSIYGSVTAMDDAVISGNPSIYYIPASPALTLRWQPATVRLHRLSYSEGW